MGNTFCCPGSRHGNRVLPTNSTVLVLGLDNKDLVSYRRHRKKDDAELGCSVVSSTSNGKLTLMRSSNFLTSQQGTELQKFYQRTYTVKLYDLWNAIRKICGQNFVSTLKNAENIYQT